MENIKVLERLENKEKYGRNVTIHAVFVRHGEKDFDPNNPETVLTSEGEIEAKNFGKKREKKRIIKPYISDTPRTKKTAWLIVEESPTDIKGQLRKMEELGFHYDPKGEFCQNAMKIKKNITGDDYENLSKEEQKEQLYRSDAIQVDYYLSFGNQRPDPNTYSPIETAALMAKRVGIYLGMAKRLKSGKEYDLINSTHDFNLVSFLKEVMIRKFGDEEVKGFNSVEEIGGSVKFNEAFEITIKTDDRGQVSASLLFRNNEYQIDMDRIDELIKIAKKLEN